MRAGSAVTVRAAGSRTTTGAARTGGGPRRRARPAGRAAAREGGQHDLVARVHREEGLQQVLLVPPADRPPPTRGGTRRGGRCRGSGPRTPGCSSGSRSSTIAFTSLPVLTVCVVSTKRMSPASSEVKAARGTSWAACAVQRGETLDPTFHLRARERVVGLEGGRDAVVAVRLDHGRQHEGRPARAQFDDPARLLDPDHGVGQVAVACFVQPVVRMPAHGTGAIGAPSVSSRTKGTRSRSTKRTSTSRSRWMPASSLRRSRTPGPSASDVRDRAVEVLPDQVVLAGGNHFEPGHPPEAADDRTAQQHEPPTEPRGSRLPRPEERSCLGPHGVDRPPVRLAGRRGRGGRRARGGSPPPTRSTR